MVIEIKLSKRSKINAGKYVAVIDDKYAELALLNWTYSARGRDKNKIYPHREVNRKTISLHRVIAEQMFGEIPAGMEVDHIDGNTLNCLESNLRLATVGQNRANAKMHFDNSLGFKGITRRKSGSYFAKLQHNKKRYSEGPFKTAEEAHQAYCAMADRIHEEYANHG